MIEIFRSIIVGGIQGVSEFLPISSSGHLVLIPYVFKWDYNGLSFDIALHFGTAIAIIAYFWKDWRSIIKSAIGRRSAEPAKNSNPQSANYPSNLLWQIILASIPAAVVGLILNDYVEKYFHSPLLIAFNLAFFGIVLWLVDKYAKKNIALNNIKYKQSFLMGCAQALALIPGVSRSGITITAGRGLGLDKENAARFSFLLATPAMLGAFLLSAKDIGKNDLDLSFLFGVIASTIFGFFAIKYLLKYLEKGNFSVFVWYRIALALIIIAVYFAR